MELYPPPSHLSYHNKPQLPLASTLGGSVLFPRGYRKGNSVRLVEPMSVMERYVFRVEVAKMVGDDDDEQQRLFNRLGLAIEGGAEIAASVASLV